MKPRTVAQLKKLIAEGLKKSPDGIARLDVSAEEHDRMEPTLAQYRRDGFRVKWSFTPKDAIDESLFRKMTVRSGEKRVDANIYGTWRVAVFPRKWKGLPLPLSEQIFKTDAANLISRDAVAQGNEAAASEKAKRPNAVISKKLEVIGENMHLGYAVRAWKPLDYLQASFPTFTLAETVGILMELYERKMGDAAIQVYNSEKGANRTRENGLKRHKIIRAMFLALRQTPGWTTERAMKSAVLWEIKCEIKPPVSERTIISACRGLK